MQTLSEVLKIQRDPSGVDCIVSRRPVTGIRDKVEPTALSPDEYIEWCAQLGRLPSQSEWNEYYRGKESDGVA